jgi:predicted RNase H-like HicB family nuclease
MSPSNELEYNVVLFKNDEGHWLASVPAIPGCHTWGASRNEALANAREAIEVCLESLEATGDAIPDADLPVEVETVRVSRPAA